MQYKSRYLKGPSLVINLYHIEQHQVSCCVTSSNIKMEPTSKRTTIVIAELIKRIQGSRGQIREALLVNVRKSFEMKPEEKFVVSILNCHDVSCKCCLYVSNSLVSKLSSQNFSDFTSISI